MTVHVVNYPEYLWFNGSEAGREFCVETWIRKARPLGATKLVLRLIPDPLFPRNPDKPNPYIELERAIMPIDGKPYQISSIAQARVTGWLYEQASEAERLSMLADARADLRKTGCKAWAILVGSKVVDQGKF